MYQEAWSNTRRAGFNPLVGIRVHHHDVVVAGLRENKLPAGCFLEASRRSIHVVLLAVFIDPGENAALEFALGLECFIGGFAPRGAQKTRTAGTAELDDHHLQSFRSILWAVVDTLGEVGD